MRGRVSGRDVVWTDPGQSRAIRNSGTPTTS